MPELHPQCPVCGSYNTKEIMIPARDEPKEFWSSTDYECLDCGSIWITGEYVVKDGRIVADKKTAEKP